MLLAMASRSTLRLSGNVRPITPAVMINFMDLLSTMELPSPDQIKSFLGLTPDRLREIVSQLEQMGLVVRKGETLRLTPRGSALNEAAKDNATEKVVEIMNQYEPYSKIRQLLSEKSFTKEALAAESGLTTVAVE